MLRELLAIALYESHYRELSQRRGGKVIYDSWLHAREETRKTYLEIADAYQERT